MTIGVLSTLAIGVLSQEAHARSHPNGIAVDSLGRVYVADSGSVEQGLNGDISIYSVSISTTGVVTATTKGAITTNISHPYSVAVSPLGDIYAGNLGTNTITKYNASLAQTGTIQDASITTYAVNMYVDQDGDLWALDAGGKIHVYLDDNTPIGALITGGISTAISPWRSNLSVWGNSINGVSTLFAPMGRFVHNSSASSFSSYSSNLLPTGVAEDNTHRLFATSSTTGIITVFDRNFSHPVTFPGYGSAIAIDSISRRIYTTIPSSGAIFIYSLNAPFKYLGQF